MTFAIRFGSSVPAFQRVEFSSKQQTKEPVVRILEAFISKPADAMHAVTALSRKQCDELYFFVNREKYSSIGNTTNISEVEQKVEDMLGSAKRYAALTNVSLEEEKILDEGGVYLGTKIRLAKPA